MVGGGRRAGDMGRGPKNVQLIDPRRLSTQLGDLIDSVYARYGIPITYFSLGYHTDYHQVTDEPQYIDYDHMARIARFVGDIGAAVANRPQRLVVDKPRPDPAGGCRQ